MRELTPERRLILLDRLAEIVKTEELTGYDCTDIGAKNTECSWGLCQQNKKLWPDAQDYIWPDTPDRIAPIDHGTCPLNMEPDTLRGCFWSCKFFQGKKPTREETLTKIKEIKEEL